MNAGILRRRAGPGVFFLVCSVAATLSIARAEVCREFEDKQHLLAFGRFELGDDRAQLPAGIEKEANCEEVPANNYYDCAYRDIDGVSYLVYGHEIVRKDIDDLERYRGAALIAGIEFGDTIATVLRKFRSLPNDFPAWRAFAGAGQDDFHVYLSPAVCLITADKINWYYDLIFSKDGRLVSITAMFESPI